MLEHFTPSSVVPHCGRVWLNLVLNPDGTPLHQENKENASSRLRRPRTAAAILQNKSTEMNTGKLDASVARIYKDEAEKEAEAFEADPNGDHPIAQEFKRSEINFQELLDTKISTKGQLMSDFKKRSEESKSLIISLRRAVSELLSRRDAVIERAITMEKSAQDSAEKSATRIAELEADVVRSQAVMESNTTQIAELQQKYADLETQLGECDAAKASALARAYQLDTELSSEKLARQSTQVCTFGPHLSSCLRCHGMSLPLFTSFPHSPYTSAGHVGFAGQGTC